MSRTGKRILAAALLLTISQLIAWWFCYVSGSSIGTEGAGWWFSGSFLLFLCVICPAWDSIK